MFAIWKLPSKFCAVTRILISWISCGLPIHQKFWNSVLIGHCHFVSFDFVKSLVLRDNWKFNNQDRMESGSCQWVENKLLFNIRILYLVAPKCVVYCGCGVHLITLSYISLPEEQQAKDRIKQEIVKSSIFHYYSLMLISLTCLIDHRFLV